MEREPLVCEFRIEGLYGYRTIAMSANHSTTVLIAKNGSGKTTLLGALDAFLRCQFGRLSNIEFDRITCRLRGINHELELSARDIERLLLVPENSEFLFFARRYGIEPQALLDFMENDFDVSRAAWHYDDDDEVFRKILAKHDYSARDAKKACEKLVAALRGRVPEIDIIRDKVRAIMRGKEVLYLPTYRRIELSLAEGGVDQMPHRRRVSVRSKLGLSRRGFFNTDIQFGLGDISEKLRDLNNELLAISNQGYRQISAKIVNDLLDGTFDKGVSGHSELPEREALAVFFSRLKQGGRHFFGPHFDTVDIPDIDKIYSQGATTYNSNKFLNYFLAQLNEVIKANQAIEGRVEAFVDRCNDYLSVRDVSTERSGYLSRSAARRDLDEKHLQIDRLTLQVSVISVAAKKVIPIDSLSSGEKQMISLFARLYLYDGPKIVLIDEPELSLSIDWQRRILLDVVRAPTCEQLVAITHSPFVFDNELDPFAKSLTLFSSPRVNSEITAADLFDGEASTDE